MKEERYRPLSRRKTLWLGVAAVVTALTILLAMLTRAGGAQPTRAVPAEPLACAAGQVSGCVGGKVDVIVPATPSPAPAAPAAGGSR
jgi:hypothetical protein